MLLWPVDVHGLSSQWHVLWFTSGVDGRIYSPPVMNKMSGLWSHKPPIKGYRLIEEMPE